MSYLVLGCRGVLIGVFLVSLVGKVRSRESYLEFVSATGNLLAIHQRTARKLAPLVVGAEAAVTSTLVLPQSVRAGFAAAAALLCCFSVALIRARHRGIDAPCRCFGASMSPVRSYHVARNCFLIALAALGSVDALASDATWYEAAGVVLTGLVTVVCVLIIARLDDLVALFGRSESPVRTVR